MAFFLCVGRKKDPAQFKDRHALRAAQNIARQNIEQATDRNFGRSAT